MTALVTPRPGIVHPPEAKLRSFAEGLEERTDRVLMESHLAFCPTCDGRVGELRAALGGLPPLAGDGAPELPGLGAGSFDALWSEVAQRERRARPPESSVLPAGALAELDPAGSWRFVTVWPQKLRVARVLEDAGTGSELYMVHLEPETIFPPHEHRGHEVSVVLEGGYKVGDEQVLAGDWVEESVGSHHSPYTGPGEECWALVRLQRGGLHFEGMRGLLQDVVERALPDVP